MTAPNVITEINNKAAIERQGRRIKHSKMLLFLHTLLTVRPLVTLGVLSAMTELVIELLSHRNPLQTFAHLGGNPMVFLLNTAIIFSTLLFALLFRRKSFYSVLVILLWLILGIINCAALTIRATPFSARDFSVFASGLMIADVYFTPLEIIGMCTGIALFSLFVVFLFTLAPRDEKRRFQAKGFLTVSALSMSLLLICFFGTRNIKLSEQYESINAAYETWGFPYCFTTTIFENGVSRPEDYSTEEVSDLGVDGTIAAAKCPNIILIQLESFFDPALIRNVELAENPIPHFTELRDSCASGYLHMPTLGAGTVNAEFEVLTGMSLDYFGLNEYPYESVLRETTCESIAYYLKELGYRAHAIHNYAGSFYGRNEVYPNLGFDDYTSVEYMSCVEYTEKEWPKDAVLTNYILQALEQTETPDFVFAVTVQCHGKYPDDSMVEDIRFNENHVFDDSASEQFLYYANQLKETDQFLGELIAAL